MLSDQLVELLQTAEAKALATNGPQGINVVPVSVVSVPKQDIIYLYDFLWARR